MEVIFQHQIPKILIQQMETGILVKGDKNIHITLTGK